MSPLTILVSACVVPWLAAHQPATAKAPPSSVVQEQPVAQTPPVDAFTPQPRPPGEAPGAKPESALAQGFEEPPKVAPPPPNWGPTRHAPPLAYPPRAEPLALTPAATAMGTLSRDDERFVTQVGLRHNGDLLLAKLALQRATGAETRDIAQRITRDEEAALLALQSMVEPRNVQIPTTVTSHYQVQRAKLVRLLGDHFDREYAQLQLQNHLTSVALYRSYAKNAKVDTDPLVRSWADTQIPILESHVQALRDVLAIPKPGV